MKSAYELAMERLGSKSPSVSLTTDQKARLAELDSVYKAKLAQEDLACQEALARLAEDPDGSKAAERRNQYLVERRRLEAEWEAKKDAVRNEKKRS